MSPNFPAKPLIPAKDKGARVPFVFLCPAPLPAGNQSQDKQEHRWNLSADHLPRTDDPGI